MTEKTTSIEKEIASEGHAIIGLLTEEYGVDLMTDEDKELNLELSSNTWLTIHSSSTSFHLEYHSKDTSDRRATTPHMQLSMNSSTVPLTKIFGNEKASLPIKYTKKTEQESINMRNVYHYPDNPKERYLKLLKEINIKLEDRVKYELIEGEVAPKFTTLKSILLSLKKNLRYRNEDKIDLSLFSSAFIRTQQPADEAYNVTPDGELEIIAHTRITPDVRHKFIFTKLPKTGIHLTEVALQSYRFDLEETELIHVELMTADGKYFLVNVTAKGNKRASSIEIGDEPCTVSIHRRSTLTETRAVIATLNELMKHFDRAIT